MSVTCGRSVIFCGYFGFFHRYNWNIVEIGIKHHNPNPLLSFLLTCSCFCLMNIGRHRPTLHVIFLIPDASGHVKFWHYTSGKCLHTINEVRTTLNVALNPEGTKFVTTGDTPQICIYDEETKKKITTLEPRYNYNRSHSQGPSDMWQCPVKIGLVQ